MDDLFGCHWFVSLQSLSTQSQQSRSQITMGHGLIIRCEALVLSVSLKTTLHQLFPPKSLAILRKQVLCRMYVSQQLCTFKQSTSRNSNPTNVHSWMPSIALQGMKLMWLTEMLNTSYDSISSSIPEIEPEY